MNTNLRADVPVCPASPERAVQLVATLNAAAAGRLRPTALRARAATIATLRRQGQLAAAERFGWLSLAGLVLELPASVACAVDPHSARFAQPADRRDILGKFPDGLPQATVHLEVVGVDVADPRDYVGWSWLQLATAPGATVNAGDARVTTAAAHTAMRARLANMVAPRG